MKTVSVVIPAYNCGLHLSRALDSVAAQTIPKQHIEVLVIDDGSTDDTPERVKAFQSRSDLVLHYVRQPNAGVAAARNHGLCLARGEVVAFLDADDWWYPSKLERQLPLLEGEVGFVYCDHAYVDEEGAPLAFEPERVNRYRRGWIELALFCDNFVFAQSTCLLRSCIDKIGYFDERMVVSEDYEFFLRLAGSFAADFIPDKLWARTYRASSLSHCDRHNRDREYYARLDLAIVSRYATDHPRFVEKHSAAVRKRLADIRWEIADCLLDKRRQAQAFRELTLSLITRPTMRALRSSARIIIPRARNG